MNLRNFIFTFIAVALILLAMDSVFSVHETQRAIVLQFGKVTRNDVEPGLHFKLPIAEEVKKFDARVLTLDLQQERYYTLEKKPLDVDSFVKWRVINVEKFYTATSFDILAARRILVERVNEGLRNQISRRDMHEVVSGERDQLMAELTADLSRVMRQAAGIEVVDVRVKKIDLPQDVEAAVYDRMTSERQIEARQYRATGEELALGIRADADRRTVVIQAEAYREAEITRGDGDASSAAIYADAFNKDPEFYTFYRSMNAYVSVFSNKGDMLVLDPSNEFFRYLKKDT